MTRRSRGVGRCTRREVGEVGKWGGSRKVGTASTFCWWAPARDCHRANGHTIPRTRRVASENRNPCHAFRIKSGLSRLSPSQPCHQLQPRLVESSEQQPGLSNTAAENVREAVVQAVMCPQPQEKPNASQLPVPTFPRLLIAPIAPITFDEFMKKLPHFVLRCCQGLPAQWSGSVHSPERLAVSLLGRTQVTLLFETLEKRIQAPRADAVSVTR